jgi:zinc protease
MTGAAVSREVLPNGLTILVDQDRSAPVVAINLWVRAGYFDEEDSETGISHVIEHMFFKGTPDRPRPDQIATEIKALGGELNAGTYYDSTHYYVVLPAENLRKGLEIQADALMHPLVDAAELQREIEAVIQEGRRKLDSAGAYAVEMMYAEAFGAHRIRRWRIGAEDLLRSMTRDQLLSYYASHYVPCRVILSIVGDVTPAEAIECAHVYLGGMPPGEGKPLGSPPEPPQVRFRRRRFQGDIKRAQTVLGYHTAPALSDDDFALRILGHVLGAGRSSRLYQSVKERAGLVDFIGASVESFRDIGILTVSAENDPAHSRAVVRAIQSEIERLRYEPPSTAEIERARAAIDFRYHQGRSEVLGRSSILAYYEALGGYALAEEAVRRLSEVTAEDVRRVASTYLSLDNATLLEYLPEGAPGDALDAAALADDLRRIEAAPALPDPAETRPAGPTAVGAVPSPPRVTRLGASDSVTRHRFETGPVLLHEARHELPIVTFSLGFRGGRSGEGRDHAGITRLMQSVMVKGSAMRDARRVAHDIEALGSAIERIVDEDYFGFSISLLSRFARKGLEILMDVVRRPAFRHEEIERERTLQLAAQETVKDQSLPYTFQLFRQAAFGSHPYALPSFGVRAPVQAMKREDLVKWHRQTVRPASMVLAVVGDIVEAEAIEMAGAALADWIQEGHGGKDPGQLIPWGASEVVETRRRRQTAQVIGFPTPGLLTPERWPLDLIQAITSGLGGRFFEEVRGKRGLAYAVHAFNYHRVSGGAFAVYLATSPAQEAEARRVLFQEIARLRREGPRSEEVERAGRFLKGAHAIALQGSTARGYCYLDAELRGLGVEAVQEYPERVAGIGFEEIQEAIWRYLDPDHCALGILRASTAGP